MPNGQLFAFKMAGTTAVWVTFGHSRSWMRTPTMAAQHQVDPNTVAVVDAASPLWLLTVAGPTPP